MPGWLGSTSRHDARAPTPVRMAHVSLIIPDHVTSCMVLPDTRIQMLYAIWCGSASGLTRWYRITIFNSTVWSYWGIAIERRYQVPCCRTQGNGCKQLCEFGLTNVRFGDTFGPVILAGRPQPPASCQGWSVIRTGDRIIQIPSATTNDNNTLRQGANTIIVSANHSNCLVRREVESRHVMRTQYNATGARYIIDGQ